MTIFLLEIDFLYANSEFMVLNDRPFLPWITRETCIGKRKSVFFSTNQILIGWGKLRNKSNNWQFNELCFFVLQNKKREQDDKWRHKRSVIKKMKVLPFLRFKKTELYGQTGSGIWPILLQEDRVTLKRPNKSF